MKILFNVIGDLLTGITGVVILLLVCSGVILLSVMVDPAILPLSIFLFVSWLAGFLYRKLLT